MNGVNGVKHRQNGSDLLRQNGSQQQQLEEGAVASSSSSDGHLMKDVLKLAVCTVGGVVFGFAAEKGRVHVPSVIQNQMSMTQFTMMKMFLSAGAAGLFGFSALYLIPQTRRLFHVVREKYISGFSTKRIPAFLLGGCLLGMGMTLAGSCPGMVLIQVGSAVPSSLFTLAGCYFGAALYGILHSTLSSVVYAKEPDVKRTGSWLEKHLRVPYPVVSLALGGVLCSVLWLLESLRPWRTEVQVSPSDVGVLEQISWPPIIAGLVMGSLQLWVSFSVEDSLGGSSAYCTVLSRAGLHNYLEYFKSYTRGVDNWWQVFYWLGAISGAATSAYLSGTWGQAVGVTPWVGFLGGAFMLFGARLASGCTSGHGLSGMALLSTASIMTVPAMFAGGMLTALVLNNTML